MTRPAVLGGDVQRTVVLTAMPLQRVGAHALAVLAGVDSPDEVTSDGFDRAAQVMTSHVAATATVGKAQEPGGFWLGVSYALWPNCPMNTTNRAKLTPEQLREGITRWRTMPDPDSWPDVPCSLCGRAAVGWYGKVDIPLGASVAHRNTTAPGQSGTPLCWPCLTTLYALPYGCAIGGGKLSAIHSWDDGFMARVTRMQVSRTLRRAAVASGKPVSKTPYLRELAALRALRTYDRRITRAVELLVFTNSNKDQSFIAEALDQPLAEWLRSTIRPTKREGDSDRRAGFGHLVAAHHTEKIPGSSLLARKVFTAPTQVPSRGVSWLADKAARTGSVPPQTATLVPLIRSYMTEVMTVLEKDVNNVTAVAKRIAAVLTDEKAPGASPTYERGALKGFQVACRDTRALQRWTQHRAVAWTLQRGAADGPFVSTSEWRSLFDSGAGRAYQDLLFIGVLEELCVRKARPDSEGALEDDTDDAAELTDFDNDTTEEN